MGRVPDAEIAQETGISTQVVIDVSDLDAAWRYFAILLGPVGQLRP